MLRVRCGYRGRRTGWVEVSGREMHGVDEVVAVSRGGRGGGGGEQGVGLQSQRCERLVVEQSESGVVEGPGEVLLAQRSERRVEWAAKSAARQRLYAVRAARSHDLPTLRGRPELRLTWLPHDGRWN
jgi:hypothetical protein